MVRRRLVNGAERMELTGWSLARLDGYKAQGCFAKIIRFPTRLFGPFEGARAMARLPASAR